MTETPAQFLRRAAEHLRGLAQAAMTHGSGRNWWTAPELGSWIPDQDDAAYMSAMHPRVALAVADTWDAIADDMRDDEVVERGAAGIGVLVLGRLFAPRNTWTAAIAGARTLLGETETN
jgi:hypothetical protein